MDEDRDEAQRYIDVALKEINMGNYDRAITLLTKAKNLYPDSQAEELKELIRKLRGQTRAKPSRETPKTPSSSSNRNSQADEVPGSTARKRKSATSTSFTTTDAAYTHDYTDEQLQLVKKINKCTNFYQVLNVSSDAADSDIKKAYKKLALQLHPDKNKAPGAAEAFKTVGNAVTVLSDEQKRKNYDTSGFSLHTNIYQHTFNHHHATFETTFDVDGDDISAEEFIKMFFGNFRSQTHQRRTYQSANQRQPQEYNQQPSIAFGVILVLILISMFSSFLTTDPVYTLAKTNIYPIRRQTQRLSVPYYVKNGFNEDYQGSLARLEDSVEKDYVYTMKQNCYRERSYREAMLARARSFGSSAQFAQAQGLKLPSCDNLAKIGIHRFALY